MFLSSPVRIGVVLLKVYLYCDVSFTLIYPCGLKFHLYVLFSKRHVDAGEKIFTLALNLVEMSRNENITVWLIKYLHKRPTVTGGNCSLRATHLINYWFQIIAMTNLELRAKCISFKLPAISLSLNSLHLK